MSFSRFITGDIVTCDLGGNVPHIGIVVSVKSQETGRALIVHNIGSGPKMEDVLFNWRITGHYHYLVRHLGNNRGNISRTLEGW
ncbi:MAG TPA: DUF1287 domain-containing protein [Candidatus Acidoferrum sp.]|nr:DUF1287 domain-containing protein [Candidatus Acidoferrum sp.]